MFPTQSNMRSLAQEPPIIIPGATLWDMFAAHALSAVIGSSGFGGGPGDHAKYAADYADALMAERARREKENE